MLTPSADFAIPPAASVAASVVDFPEPSFGLSSLWTESTALSVVRFALRPMFVPKRFIPSPMPFAVAPGSFTAAVTPLPTFSTELPAAARKTWLFDTSSSLARAPTS